MTKFILLKLSIFHIVITFFTIFNMISFKLGVNNAILPIFETCIVYYASLYHHSSLLPMFSYGLIIDFFQGNRLCTTSLTFIISFLLFTSIQKKFKLLSYFYTCIIFPIYLILFIAFKFFLISMYSNVHINYQYTILQIINTTLFYLPISKALQYILNNFILNNAT